MPDAISAVRDLLTVIPLKVRRAIYGIFGAVILVDGIWKVLPEDISSQVVATFGVLGLVLALANTAQAPALPPPRAPLVEPNFPDEFA